MNCNENIAHRRIEDLIKTLNTKVDLLKGQNAKLADQVDEIANINNEIANLDAELQKFRETSQEIETEMFYQFLASINRGKYKNIKEFESAYYNNHQEDYERLRQLQEEKVQLTRKLDELKKKDFEGKKTMWDSVIENLEKKLDELIELLLIAQTSLEFQEEDYDNLLVQAETNQEGYELAKRKLNEVTGSLKIAYRQKDDIAKSIQNATLELVNRRKSRHDLFNKAYVDAIKLPVNQRQFMNIFSDQTVDDGNFDNEDDLVVNFDSIQELTEEVCCLFVCLGVIEFTKNILILFLD